MSLPDQIAAELRQHVGRENAIKSGEIAARLGLPESASRTIRNIIADEDWEARELPVVAIPGIGFYVASDIAECDAYLILLCMLRDGLSSKIEKFVRSCAKQGLHLNKHHKSP